MARRSAQGSWEVARLGWKCEGRASLRYRASAGLEQGLSLRGGGKNEFEIDSEEYQPEGEMERFEFSTDAAVSDEQEVEATGAELLAEAARAGELERVQNLVEHEHVDVNTEDLAGCTPLHFAAANGHVQVARYLLGQHAELSKNKRGNTPLHWAVQNSQEQVVELLLAHERADVLDRNDMNVSALTYACEADDENITALLLSHKSASPLEDGACMEVCESASDDLLSPEDAAIVEETTLDLSISSECPTQLRCRLLGLSWKGEAFSGTKAERDSTGIYLWAASVITARWVYEIREELRGRSVCEIGAGCGLPSLSALRFTDAKVVMATDSFKHSLENLRVNVQLNDGAGSLSDRMQIEKLDWMDESTWPSAGSFDILIGSDILYDHEQV
eukprot:746828-Hanusia_phi.AAC.1